MESQNYSRPAQPQLHSAPERIEGNIRKIARNRVAAIFLVLSSVLGSVSMEGCGKKAEPVSAVPEEFQAEEARQDAETHNTESEPRAIPGIRLQPTLTENAIALAEKRLAEIKEEIRTESAKLAKIRGEIENEEKNTTIRVEPPVISEPVKAKQGEQYQPDELAKPVAKAKPKRKNRIEINFKKTNTNSKSANTVTPPTEEPEDPRRYKIAGEQGKYYYQHENGKNIFGNMTFYQARPYSEGFALVRDSSRDDWYFISKNGENCFGMTFKTASDFENGIAVVSFWRTGMHKAQYCYINLKGHCLYTPSQFDEAKEFHNGVGIVKKDDKYWYIDRSGHDIFPGKKFDAAREFSEDLAVVASGGHFYYINRKGERMFGSKEFSHAGNFKDGYAQVSEGMRAYKMDKNGKEVSN